ncbi:hypothetical protein CKO09_01580 [Chromatium weissei]|nr:hypothetical protein [Chromatium weissei]
MNKAQTVTATFNAKPINYSLAISKIGTGTVKSSDGKINCGIGSGCIADFEKGSNVILTAIPDSGSTFVSWTGCTAETTNALQCQFKITANKTVTANFATIPSGYTLTVKTTGNGIVISNPVGINCGADCAENFTSTEVVMLTAKPSDGENLLNWNGCVANATNPMQCRVTLNKNVNVTAAFSNKTTPNADIQITDVVLIPVAPSSGKSFKAQITLKNIGNVVLENGGNLEVWVNEPAGQSCGASGDGFADIDKLVRNESKTVTVDLVAPEKGIQRLRVFADSRCQVKELSEQNNQSVTRYTVK